MNPVVSTGVSVAAALAFGVQAIRAGRLLTSALWLAAASAALSVTLYGLGAPQLAVIELSIGAGLVTVLFVFAIGIAGEETTIALPLVPRPLGWGLVLVLAGLLAWLVMPAYPTGLPGQDMGFTETLWQARSLDVLMQVVLIFSGVLGLLGVLAEARPPLQQPMAKAVAAERDRQLKALQQRTIGLEQAGEEQEEEREKELIPH
jgi:NADH:ubiquinone oxidoreductase subunit 6 (subunit J)